MYKLTLLEMRRLYHAYVIANREEERRLEQQDPEYAEKKRRQTVRQSDLERLRAFKNSHQLE